MGTRMKTWITNFVEYIAGAIELLTALVMAYACLMALIRYFKDAFSASEALKPKVEIRLALGRSLTVALELL